MVQKIAKRLGLSRQSLNVVFTAIESIAGDCRGKFPDFAAARAAVPLWCKVGYNNPEAAELYVSNIDRVRPSDFAALYWLRPLIPGNWNVFDFGGNVGLSYYAFRPYLNYQDDLKWVVCDVPAVTAVGERLAKERHASHLRFVNDFGAADGCGIVTSSGTLQYVEEPLADSIARLQTKPRHLLINRTAIWDGETFITLQDIGPILCPYRITNRQSFVASLENLGYKLISSWQCHESGCQVRFRPRMTLEHYWGFYFELPA